MRDDDRAEMIAKYDQAGAAVKDAGPVLSSFYRSLRANGVGVVGSAVIVGSWLAVSLSNETNNDSK